MPLQATKSRLSFYCLTCKVEGPRSQSYVHRKRSTPCYDDMCPFCGSDDVEVFDSRYSKPSDELELAFLNSHIESQTVS